MEQVTQSSWEEVKNDFSILEIRMIQSLWQEKSIQYIANMLDRPYGEVERKVSEMNSVQRVDLYKLPSFERKIPKKDQKEEAWAKRQLAEHPSIQIPDSSDKISVRIDHKTVVLVNAGTDIEKYKKEYFKRKANSLK